MVDTYPKRALADDARHLASMLDTVHPDPYSGHGGRVAFHRRREELLRGIPDDGLSRGQYYHRLQRFVARIRDGHTEIEAPACIDAAVGGRLSVGWCVVGERLYVAESYDDADTDLLGARLLSVEGLDLETLRERQARTSSADNRYGDLKHLGRILGSNPDGLHHVLDESAVPPAVTVERPDGTVQTRTLSVVDPGRPVATLDSAVDTPDTDGHPAYRLLDDGATALLVLPDAHSHREVHEVVAAPGGPGASLYDTAATYRRLVGEPVPDSHDEMVADLPSATEILTDLVDEMADAGTQRLVVDTRTNAGGTSILPYILAYVLYGWDGIERTLDDQYDAVKLSEPYREHRGEEAPVEATDDPDGFDVSSYFTDPQRERQQLQSQLEQLSPTFEAEIEAGTHEARYQPDSVAVVTGAETFSAGLEIAALLSKLGAEVVGVPPSQSPNGPRDKLTTDLPNTGLTATISYRYHAFHPGTEGTILQPDRQLTPERFEDLGRTADASVELALRDE